MNYDDFLLLPIEIFVSFFTLFYNISFSLLDCLIYAEAWEWWWFCLFPIQELPVQHHRILVWIHTHIRTTSIPVNLSNFFIAILHVSTMRWEAKWLKNISRFMRFYNNEITYISTHKRTYNFPPYLRGEVARDENYTARFDDNWWWAKD